MAAIRLFVDDRLIEERDASPTTTLLRYLRDHLGCSGTKEGCAEGDCGACTVAVLEPDDAGRWVYRAINSCLVPLPSLHGRRVYTAEGISRNGGMHQVQRALVDASGSQCGYCTPGVVMSMFEACYREHLDAPWKLDDQMCGNLCRCTGYRPILDATRAIWGTGTADEFTEVRDAGVAPQEALFYEAEGERFAMPVTLDGLYDALSNHPNHRIVCGATDLGLEVTKQHARYPCLISVEAVAEMRGVERVGEGWRIGAAMRLSEVESFAADAIPSLARMLRFFGARQIKHRATLGGNLCNASPIGDTAPVLMALDATVVIGSPSGERRVSLDDFFVGYRKTALAHGEVLIAIEVPDLPPDATVGAYKVSKRRELDISSVAGAFRVRLNNGTVTEARLAYGGMAATTSRASKTERALVGERWTETSVRAAMRQLSLDFTPMSDHRGSAWYRATVAGNLLLGFFFETEMGTTGTLPDRPSGTTQIAGVGP